MMKILITGSNGMLGSALSGILKAEYEITGVDINGKNIPGCEPQKFFETDITDAQKVEKLFDNNKFDLIVHAAAYTDVDGCEIDPATARKVNVDGTRNLAGKAAKSGISMISISTDFVFDGNSKVPYKETDATDPLSIYGRTKLEAEKEAERYLKDCLIIRTSWLFGENGRNFVDTIIRKARTDKHLRVVDDQIGSPTYTKDLARAIKEIIKKTKINGRCILNVSNSDWCSWYGFTKAILAEIKLEDVILEAVTTERLARPAQRPKFSVLDNGKLENIIGHPMRPWREALREYLEGKYDGLRGS